MEVVSVMAVETQYKYLVSRPHPWKKQLFVKGCGNLTARSVVGAMYSNGLTPEQVAKNFDLPVEAVLECIQYYEENKDMVDAEVREERRRGGLDPYEDKPLKQD
jgi:uncharacterized protein (DUF433 family)